MILLEQVVNTFFGGFDPGKVSSASTVMKPSNVLISLRVVELENLVKDLFSFHSLDEEQTPVR